MDRRDGKIPQASADALTSQHSQKRRVDKGAQATSHHPSPSTVLDGAHAAFRVMSGSGFAGRLSGIRDEAFR
jgi:hypothetical protein